MKYHKLITSHMKYQKYLPTNIKYQNKFITHMKYQTYFDTNIIYPTSTRARLMIIMQLLISEYTKCGMWLLQKCKNACFIKVLRRLIHWPVAFANLLLQFRFPFSDFSVLDCEWYASMQSSGWENWKLWVLICWA